jgi:hypothetical protein
MVEDAFGYSSVNAGVLGILNYDNLTSSNFAYLPTSGPLVASEGYDQIFDHSIVQANPESTLPVTGNNYNDFTLSAAANGMSYFYEFDTFNQHPF